MEAALGLSADLWHRDGVGGGGAAAAVLRGVLAASDAAAGPGPPPDSDCRVGWPEVEDGPEPADGPLVCGRAGRRYLTRMYRGELEVTCSYFYR